MGLKQKPVEKVSIECVMRAEDVPMLKKVLLMLRGSGEVPMVRYGFRSVPLEAVSAEEYRRLTDDVGR